ncbi:molybdopterin oxidoreductase family protein [Moritella viscosa]|uniref:Nitrate reductase n=1 Tax=Moritella viscosa TaxID=80854 RepID=A0A090INC4_9GAMM|nr:nitrate reductase [Moritella viscosa]CED61999.1 nitrate reductase [Moritella viscosa]SGY91787.1 Nitrate reductase [Moritella viscosa]SGY96122.1 Nitrate reductase [Moritella viscosa]SGZ01643.1 Nitrate reductase [Moritella viscosa]SGZ02076.1 Nitrate reductase [Moritella viscosa]
MIFGRKDQKPIRIADKQVKEWKYTTCGYCSTGCSIEIGINKQGNAVASRGVADADVNRGKLCIKGIFEHELFDAAGRGNNPLVRDHIHDQYKETSWDSALDTMGDKIKAIQAQYGKDSFAIVSTGQLLTEEFYTLGKLTRGCIGTNNYDGNTTLCMASAVSGYKRSFGSDGPPGCYDDFLHTDCLIAWGSNLPEQHPVIYWRLKEAKEQRNFPLIVVDPRVTMLAQFADIHLPISPGTDIVLQNSLMHVILKEGLEDKDYIEKYTNGIEELRACVEDFDPTSAAKICGIDEDTIRHVARLFAKAGRAMSIWTMGLNQSTHGSDAITGCNSLSLITGNIGVPGGTSLSITGQCNAMGTREWSSCSGLPGYRALEKEKDRNDIAEFWGIDPEFFPKKRGLAQTDIFPAIETGQIKGLWLVATNPMTSMPNTSRIRKTLEKLDFLVVQDAYQDVETTQYAHMFLPAAVWAEKEGVFTNTERRVNRVSNVQAPKGNSKSDFWIFSELSKRFENGQKITFPVTTEEAFEEMKTLSKGAGRNLDISGMTYEKIEKARGLQWPYREGATNNDEGARLYTDGKFATPTGKANLIPLPWIDNNEHPCDEYPFWLNSGRVVEHFHTRTRTGKMGNLNKYSPTPYMEMNPDAAAKLGIKHQSYVRLASRRGDAVVMVQLTQRVAPNAVFIPFHFHDCVNRLSLGLLDPHSRQPAFKQSSIRIEHVDQKLAAKMNRERRTY